MDIALCAINADRTEMEFAGAYNSLWLVRNKELTEYKADKYPIGLFLGENLQEFSNQVIALQKEVFIYFFTEGFADRFGAPKEKKLKYKHLQLPRGESSKKPMDVQ